MFVTWRIKLLFHCHSCNSSAACLSFHVRVCPTELPWIQQWGVWVVGGIRNVWHMSHISTHPFTHSPSLSFSLHPPLTLQQRKKKKHHAWVAELSNSHQPPVNPQGDRENSKHRFPAKNKEHTAVRPLSAACLLCKGPSGCQSHCGMPG